MALRKRSSGSKIFGLTDTTNTVRRRKVLPSQQRQRKRAMFIALTICLLTRVPASGRQRSKWYLQRKRHLQLQRYESQLYYSYFIELLLTRLQPTGTRRKLDAATEIAVPNQQPQKRRRISTSSRETQAIVTAPLDQTTTITSATLVGEAIREDSVTAENIAFASVSNLRHSQIDISTDTFRQECLSSDNELEPQQPAQAPLRLQSTSKNARPMTPTSPGVVSNPFQRENRSAVTPGRAAPGSRAGSHNTTAAPPGQRTLQASPALQVEQHQSSPTNLPPFLILEKADGSFDEDDPLPSTLFRNSTVNEFFSFVSDTIGKPRDSFDRLTFTFLFVRGGDCTRLIHEGDDTAWNKLKKKAKFLCNLYRTRTEESELQLVVEFGDKRTMVEEL
jgi:hypothetical protein